MNRRVSWKFFTKVNANCASCNQCGITIKFCGNTTNLRRHLTKQHTKLFDLVQAEAQKRGSVEVEEQEITTTDSSEPDDGNAIANIAEGLPSQKRKTQQRRGNKNLSPSTSATSSTILVPEKKRKKKANAGIEKNIAYEKETCTVKRTTIESCLSMQQSYSVSGNMHVRITDTLMYMITKDNLPFTTVEKEGFEHFMVTVASKYKIPCDTTITKNIDAKYYFLRSSFQKKMANVDYFSLTANLWTESHNTTSILGVTAHYIDEEGKLK